MREMSCRFYNFAPSGFLNFAHRNAYVYKLQEIFMEEFPGNRLACTPI